MVRNIQLLLYEFALQISFILQWTPRTGGCFSCESILRIGSPARLSDYTVGAIGRGIGNSSTLRGELAHGSQRITEEVFRSGSLLL